MYELFEPFLDSSFSIAVCIFLLYERFTQYQKLITTIEELKDKINKLEEEKN